MGSMFFCQCFFVPLCRRISKGEPFCDVFQKVSGSEKVLEKRGDVSPFSVTFFFVPLCQKIE